MSTLEMIAAEWGVDTSEPSPILVHDRGRLDLAHLFARLGYTRGAEIGVERGLYSEQLCLANPTLTLTAVDAWRAHRGYRDHTNQTKLDAFYEEARARLAPYRVDVVRRFSEDAAAQVPDRSLDFAYIDANHDFQHVVADLAAWGPKVRPGGILAGHDYVSMKWVNDPPKPYLSNQVVAAVRAWTEVHEIRPWFVLRGDVEGEDRTWGPSTWMWVRE